MFCSRMPSRKSGKSGGRQIARYAGDFLLDWIPGYEEEVSYVPQVSLHIVTIMFTSIQTFPMIWHLWSRYGGENLWVMPGPFTALLWLERSIAEVSQRLRQQLNPAIGISFHFPVRSLCWRLVEQLFAADTRHGSVFWERFCEQYLGKIMPELQKMHARTHSKESASWHLPTSASRFKTPQAEIKGSKVGDSTLQSLKAWNM